MIDKTSIPITNTEDVKICVNEAKTALNKITGFLPVNVGFPLASAQGKLNLMLCAIDAWESKLRLDLIINKNASH